MNTQRQHLLIGNTFPITHIRREVHITPRTIMDLRAAAADSTIYSFWGHPETLKKATIAAGFDLTPSSNAPTARPTLGLSTDLLPMLNGMKFADCWVLSPNSKENIRPPVGQAVAGEQIEGWQVLHLTWP